MERSEFPRASSAWEDRRGQRFLNISTAPRRDDVGALPPPAELASPCKKFLTHMLRPTSVTIGGGGAASYPPPLPRPGGGKTNGGPPAPSPLLLDVR